MKSLINVSNVNFAYEDLDKNYLINVLKSINLNIESGEFICILGNNGSGKSTLAKHLNGILLPSGGKIFIDGLRTSDESKTYKIRSTVGIVFQNPDNQIVSTIVQEDVAFGPENLGIEPSEIRDRVNWALRSVGMLEFKDREIHTLSGGQKQKVAIASILAMKPKCIVLDEPTAMLDPIGRDDIMNVIKYLNEKGISIVLISHFMEEAAFSNRILVMFKGNIVMDAKPREIFSQIDLLRKYNLNVPKTTELLYKLKLEGYNVENGVWSEEDCADQILKLLEEI